MDVADLKLATTLASIDSTNSPTDGILLDGIAGDFEVVGPTTIVGPANNGIDCRGDSFTATFDATAVTGAGGTGVFLANPGGEFSITNASHVSLGDDDANVTFGDGDVTFRTLKVN